MGSYDSRKPTWGGQKWELRFLEKSAILREPRNQFDYGIYAPGMHHLLGAIMQHCCNRRFLMPRESLSPRSQHFSKDAIKIHASRNQLDYKNASRMTHAIKIHRMTHDAYYKKFDYKNASARLSKYTHHACYQNLRYKYAPFVRGRHVTSW